MMAVISLFPVMILAEDQTQQKKVSQPIEKRDKTHTTENSKAILERQVSKQNDFDYGPLSTLLGITVSVALIIWQIGRQYKNNIELQRENNREKLKLEIYSDYRKRITEAQQKIISASTKAQAMVDDLKFNLAQIQRGGSPLSISGRAKDMRDAHYAAIFSLVDLSNLIEQYEIINPNLEIFLIGFSYANHCMEKAFVPYHQLLLEFLPLDVLPQDQARAGTDVIGPRKEASKDDLERMEQRAKDYGEATFNASCYVLDLAKEAQNIFLGKLFSHTIPPRKPLDPKYIVLSTEPQNFSKLKRYFLEETEWGKEQKNREKEIEEEVKKKTDP